MKTKRPKPLKMSVHRNTVERRRKKELANDITRMGAKMCKDNDVRAYALVGINSDGSSVSIWDTGSVMPIWAFAVTIAAILRRDIEESGIEEDWKPPTLSSSG